MIEISKAEVFGCLKYLFRVWLLVFLQDDFNMNGL